MARHSVQESAGFGSLAHDVSKLVRRHFDKKATGVGLTQSQSAVIHHLFCNEGINQATLAELLDIEPITLVGLLDRLEEAGWVERRLDENDRRARLLFLTKRAQPILKKIDSIKTQVRAIAFEGISSQEQRQLMEILQKVRHNLSVRSEAKSSKHES